MEWRNWPALAGAPYTHRELKCLRGVYGKVHHQPSDYRWIATSSGWPDGLERRINLGKEDVSVKFPFWFPDGDLLCAGWCYPTPALDEKGRKTPIEKQMLIWHAEGGLPPVAAAFLMLDTA